MDPQAPRPLRRPAPEQRVRRITRHRLNRFGDRSLNKALHTIVNWRMIHGHEPAQHYLTRRRAEQKSDPEIRRCLKRYTARHLFRLMEATAAP